MSVVEFLGICFGLEQGPGLACRVVPTGTGLNVSIKGQSPVSVGYTDLKVSLSGVDDRYLCFEARYKDRDLKILVPDRGILIRIQDLGAPGQFLAELDHIAAKCGRRVAMKWAFPALLAVAAALAVAAVWFGLGSAVSLAVRAIPVEWEQDLGGASASQILADEQVCSDPELKKAADEIGMRLVSGLGASPYTFRFRILNSDDVNAFALPGGYVFINRGLIEQADDGAEVAGVLAHEIQHVLHRHGLGNLARQAGIALVLGAVAGDAGGLEQFLMYNAASLASMSFSRDQETEADLGGLDLMRRAGLDQTGLPRFLAKLAKEEGSLPSALALISSHPASKDRVKELNAMIASGPKSEIIPLKSDLTRVRGLCSPILITDPDAP
jgi:hypothetical protein